MAPLIGFSATLHAAGVAALAAWPRLWPTWCLTLFLDHVLLATAGCSPRSSLLGPNISRLPLAASDSRVALTFDDGPDPEVTPRVLDLLEENRARATFFVIGRRLEDHPGLVEEIVARGHSVQNHSYHHSYGFAFLGPWSLAREVDRTQALIRRLTGQPASFFRAPAGIRSPWLEGILARRGLTLVSWTRRGYDAVATDPRRVLRRLLAGLSGGDILLLHDGDVLGRKLSNRPVLQVLPELLAELRKRGFESIALDTANSIL